jgi:epsilon-lactone hydrolase
MVSSPENVAMKETMRKAARQSYTDFALWRRDIEAAYAVFNVPESVRREVIDAGGVGAEWFHVGGAGGRAVLYFHGGGYALGSTRSHQALIGELAVACGVDTLGVNYRLAPECPFPAAVQDAVTSYRYLLGNGFAAERIVCAGDSAGGGLTAALLLAIRKDGLPNPACAVMISPWTDLSNSLPSIGGKAEVDPILMKSDLDTLAHNYLGNQNPRQPLASPLFGDWVGAPPMYIQVGGHEILHDDAVELSKTVAAAGVDVELEVAEECVHVYPQYSQLHPEGVRGVQNAAEYIRRRLGI